jgi:hypothetical protein
MLIKLNGWQRIGIVMSAIWFLGFFLYQWNSRVTGVRDLYELESIACYEKSSGYVEKQEDADLKREKCRDKASADHDRNFGEAKAEIPLLLVADFVTVVLGWLVAWIVVSITRWIRRGSL